MCPSTVMLCASSSTFASLMAGVMPGDRVVVSGPDDLEDGQRVKEKG